MFDKPLPGGWSGRTNIGLDDTIRMAKRYDFMSWKQCSGCRLRVVIFEPLDRVGVFKSKNFKNLNPYTEL